MKKSHLMTAVLTAALAAAPYQALAENLAGKFAGSGRIGFTVPSDGDTGFIFGGGLMYGITRNIAADVELSHAVYDARSSQASLNGTANVTNLSLGGQWRFAGAEQYTPYAGGGLSILFNDQSGAAVDDTVGVNLKGGIDYFIDKRLALNAELKWVISPTAAIHSNSGIESGSFDPGSFSGLFGVRYVFN